MYGEVFLEHELVLATGKRPLKTELLEAPEQFFSGNGSEFGASSNFFNGKFNAIYDG